MKFLDSKQGVTMPFKVMISLLLLIVGVVLAYTMYKFGASGMITLFNERVLGAAP